MPYSAPRLQGCGCVTSAGQACLHQRARKAERDARRPSSSARGYTSKWANESKAWLAQPGREWCACGCLRPADMVDHIVAPKGDKALFWRRSNWRPFNSLCNRRKNIREEGGFGRKPAPGGPADFPGGDGNRWGRSARDGDELEFLAGVPK